MASNQASMCPLCRNENVKIYAVGECSHPVCHLCATKMRILCEQTYCAICRQDLPRVYYVSDLTMIQSTIDQSRFTPIDETGDCGIYYPIKTEWIRRETEKLLRNFCPFCHSESETFEMLREHVRRQHRYFYCELCVEHLNLFPSERKCYTRHDLVQHMRVGDREDTSFKGHPLCRFCDDHFLDVDQLYQHMRKEHFFCHLCDSDNVYYSDFELLREHFRSSHYLCEIGACKDVQFTNAFRSEIDFRAHQASQHAKTRAEIKQMGTVALEFQSANRRQQRDPVNRGTFSRGEFNTQSNNNASRNEETRTEPVVELTVPTIDEFPTLGVRSATPQHQQHRSAWLTDSLRRVHSSEDFPALTTGKNAPKTNVGQPRGIWREQATSTAAATNTSNTVAKKPAPSGTATTNGIGSKDDFPALKGTNNPRVPAPVSMISAWSTAQAAKNASANNKKSQKQIRVSSSRLANRNDDDDDEEEFLRRPMSTLMTNTAPAPSANITVISSADMPGAQNVNTTKNQSVPQARDFPALSSTAATKKNTAPSGVWSAGGANRSDKSSTQQKKKTGGMSKKKFMVEVQAMAPPPTLLSDDDFPAMGLNELGRRLLVDESEPVPPPPPPPPTTTTKIKEPKPSSPSAPTTTATKIKEPKPSSPPAPPTTATKIKEPKPSSSPTPPPTSSSSTTKQQTEASKSAVQKTSSTTNKKSQKPTPVNSEKSETPAKQPEASLSSQSKPTDTQPPPTPQQRPVQDEPTPLPPPTQPPPGFVNPAVASPPPGFTVPSSTSTVTDTSPSFIFPTSYDKQKEEFRAKLLVLFDNNVDLFVQYNEFCNAFYQNSITSNDFIRFTTQLFNDKLDEYLLELIVLTPNIDKQNELYTIWTRDIHPTSLTTQNAGWTKKNLDETKIEMCRVCRQILFKTDVNEHNGHHTDFNAQFPSLPIAVARGGNNGSGRKKK